jgi:hypothetical protein
VRSGIGLLRFGALDVPADVPARSTLVRVYIAKGFAPSAAGRDVPRSGSASHHHSKFETPGI